MNQPSRTQSFESISGPRCRHESRSRQCQLADTVHGGSLRRFTTAAARRGLTVAAAIVLAALFPGPCSEAQLLSARDPSIAAPAGGNGHSTDAVISPGGRFVVFSSAACDLVPGDDRQFYLDVFLRDRASNSTVLVSINLNGTGGGDSHSLFGQVSTNGRYVVFQSDADNLVTNDANGSTDIFIRDLVAGATTVVSVSTNGVPGNGVSSDAVMSPDGRYVAFVSTAPDLVPGDTNGMADVFVRDTVANTTTLASVGAVPYGTAVAGMATPAITPDGRFVAFFSTAAGLGATNPPTGEVYVCDMLAGTTTWASTNAAAIALNTFGTLTNYASYHPCLSDDGAFVAFKAGGTNLGSGNVILQYELATGVTTIISTNGLGAFPDDEDRYGPEMTPDGRFVAYARAEAGTNGVNSSVHLWDSQTATDILISDDGSGVPTNTISHTPALSPDGRFVCFLSNATNLFGNAVSNGFHAYVCDLQLGTMQLVDVDTNGVGSTDIQGTVPGLSADGGFVVFTGPDGSLVSQDNNGMFDVFVRDTTAGTTELISQRDPALVPDSGNGIVRLCPFSISADGRWIMFDSAANDLVPNDANGMPDVFVRDSVTGQTVLVSVGTDGNPALGGASSSAAISPDGRYVVFVSSATNLIAGQTNIYLNIYRRDLQLETTILVSVSTNGINAGNGNSSSPVMSSDGRYVTFLSAASNLAPGAPATASTYGNYTFQRDIDSGSTVMLTIGPGTGTKPFAPSVSADGRYVAYQSVNSPDPVQIHDMQLGMDVYTNGNTTSAVLSPDGTRLLYFRGTSPYGVYVDDVATHSNLFSFPSKVPIWGPGQWSSNGQFVAFVSTTNSLSGGDNNTNKVYLADLQTGVATLVSVNYTHTGGANAASDMPVVSADGRWVAYRSFATNIVAGDLNPAPKIFLFDRLTGLNAVLSPAQTDSSAFPWIGMPVMSAGGQSVAFLSVGSSLVSGDLNRVSDAFTIGVDSDGDGIPDYWMMEYFSHPTGQAGDLSLASDDAAGDGISNLQAYLDGINPTNAMQDFGLEILPVSPSDNTVTLVWSTTFPLNYQVQYKTNLSDPDWIDLPGSASIITNRAYLTLPADQSSRFFRVMGSN